MDKNPSQNQTVATNQFNVDRWTVLDGRKPQHSDMAWVAEKQYLQSMLTWNLQIFTEKFFGVYAKAPYCCFALLFIT